jgi:hypothetical protein
MPQLPFNLEDRAGRRHTEHVDVNRLTIAGWAGRDQAAIEHHIAELAELGVKRPSTTPCFYRLGAELLTQAEQIDVVGAKSSGEAECVLLQTEAGLLVTIGSDHTDREVEAYGVTVSKQVCPKPLARDAWRLDDVAGHWDQLELRAYALARGERRVYQQGSVAALLPAAELLARAPLSQHAAMFCGTLAVQGGIVGMADGDALELELHDPVLKRTLCHAYRVRALPIVE